MRAIARTAAALVVVVALVGGPARADSTITVASGSPYTGLDSSLVAGKWTVTTLAVEGSITQVGLRVRTLDGAYVTGLGWHPKLNQTVTTWDVIPPGTYRVEMWVWNPNDSKVGSATFALETP